MCYVPAHKQTSIEMDLKTTTHVHGRWRSWPCKRPCGIHHAACRLCCFDVRLGLGAPMYNAMLLPPLASILTSWSSFSP